ncbi:MAG: imidazole glycerol phosphate synthase subunit HisH [Candidatus Omnitrophica bacterium]|nr:imidazole glycerol phosphate synthase subunit HisH [Candidatus Omnitrophota bacterium]
MIAIIDYGMGNLRSVQKALEKVGAQVQLSCSPQVILNADQVVLPGVGAMAPAMQKLKDLGLVDAIHKTVKSGKPFLGICLGLQLLFDKSSEGGHSDGLRILEGTVERFTQLKVPHMGWNQLQVQPAGKDIYKDIPDGENVYFCHSYFIQPKDKGIVASTTNYGVDFVSSIVKDNIWGVQFHPEKSQQVGLQILRRFTQL